MEPEKADIDRVKDPELRATLLRIKELMDADTRAFDPEPEPQTGKVIQLPIWPEPVRGTPNSLLRGALFAAIQSKDKRYRGLCSNGTNMRRGAYSFICAVQEYAE